jgi:mannose-6-phosphate isomerase
VLPLLKFSPVLLAKPWGGDALYRVLGKGDAGDARMGESWELSDRPEAPSRVSEGPLAGRALADLLGEDARAPSEILGDLPADRGFPLLYKFIAAREKLSVQVHPGAGSSRGEAKTECWYVVDAPPGAALIVGVHPAGRGREETLGILKSPRCEEILSRLPARRGDVFFVPAGTVHAITEGLLLYEVQQNSDTTYRLYDWGRVDAAGKPRALHVAEAGEVADLEAREGYHIPALSVDRGSHVEDFLVACPYFALVKWRGFKAPARLETRGRFRVLTVVSGALTLTASDGGALSLGLGETALVPACHESVTVTGSPGAELIVSFVPDLDRDVVAPLRAVGHAPEAIARLFGPPGLKV